MHFGGGVMADSTRQPNSHITHWATNFFALFMSQRYHPIMIIRTVFVKLHDEWANDRGRKTIGDHAQQVLSALPGVVRADIGFPADQGTEEAWDLTFQVHFQRFEDVEPYRVHLDHLDFLNHYLSPKAVVKKVWNFRIA